MSNALKQLQHKRSIYRLKLGISIIMAILGWGSMLIMIGIPAYVVALNVYSTSHERKEARALKIASNNQLFMDLYGTWWPNFPKKYRTKLDVVRQDYGLTQRDVFTPVFGGGYMACPDVPSNWWPGDMNTALEVVEDLKTYAGKKVADNWLDNWYQLHTQPTYWGIR